MKTLKILVALVVIFAANLLNAQSSKYNYSNEPGFFE